MGLAVAPDRLTSSFTILAFLVVFRVLIKLFFCMDMSRSRLRGFFLPPTAHLHSMTRAKVRGGSARLAGAEKKALSPDRPLVPGHRPVKISPDGQKSTHSGLIFNRLLEAVLPAEVLQTLRVDLQERGGSGLLAARPPQGGIEVGHLNALQLRIKIHALFWDENRFLAGGGGVEQLLWEVL